MKKTLFALVLFFGLSLGVAGPVYSQGPNQTKCPVLGGSVNKRVYSDYQGKRVYFCCPPCIREFQKDPEKYIRLLEKQGVVLEEAPKAEKK